MKNKPANVLGSKTATAAEKSAVCLTCHGGQRQLENWSVAKHRKVDVTCVNCHSIHGTQSASNNKEIKGAQFAAAPYTTTARQLTYKRCVECHTRRARRDPQAVAPPDHRRQGRLPGLPRPARLAAEGEPAQRLAQRPVRELPRRQARPVDPRASPGRGELRHLPHAARLGAPRAARAEGAGALRRLPRERPHARHLRRTRDAAQARCRRTSASWPAAASIATGRSTAATRRRPPSANTSCAEIRGRT